MCDGGGSGPMSTVACVPREREGHTRVVSRTRSLRDVAVAATPPVNEPIEAEAERRAHAAAGSASERAAPQALTYQKGVSPAHVSSQSPPRRPSRLELNPMGGLRVP